MWTRRSYLGDDIAMRRFTWGIVALLVVGCSASPPQDRGQARDDERDRAPDIVRPGLATLPDPEVRVEPRSRYGNHTPYMVFGKTYHVMPEVREYEATGTASWYGQKFQGRPTSSGEPYDLFELTAAHRSLPLPTYLKVTNLANGRATVVRVNDRGPFHDDRIIDLSYAAAVKLGFADRGTAQVRLELLRPETVPPAPVRPAPVPAEPAPTGIFLQAGAFARRQGAEQLESELTALVGRGVHIDRSGDDALFRVRVGPIEHMSEAARLQALIVTSDLGMPLIVREAQ